MAQLKKTIITGQLATDVQVTVLGASSQSADLQQWQNNVGAVLAKISSAGDITGATISGGAVTSTGGNFAGLNSLKLEIGTSTNQFKFDASNVDRLIIDTSSSYPKIFGYTGAGASTLVEFSTGIYISSSLYVDNTFYVRGAIQNDQSTNNGRVYVNDNFQVTGSSYFDNTITVGTTTFATNGNITVGNTLTISGSAPSILVPSGAASKSIQVNGDTSTYIGLKSHNNHTIFRNQAGLWTFQSGTGADSWTETFQLYQAVAASPGSNNQWFEIGQRTSNGTNGTYTGVKIVKYNSNSIVDGDFQAGNITATGTINIGSDVNIYRDSANLLKTDDAFTAAGVITGGTSVIANNSGGGNAHMYLQINGTNRSLLYHDATADKVTLRKYVTASGISNYHDLTIDDNGLLQYKKHGETAKNIPVASANNSDYQLTITSPLNIVAFTPATTGNFMIYVYYRVVVAATNLTLQITYTDGSGSQTVDLVSTATPQAVGSYHVVPVMINATTSSPIKVIATAGTAGQIYVSATIMGI